MSQTSIRKEVPHPVLPFLVVLEKATKTNYQKTKIIYAYRTPQIPGDERKNTQKNGNPHKEKKRNSKKTKEGRDSESVSFAISFAKPFAIANESICSASFAASSLRFCGQNSLSNFQSASEFAFAFAAVSVRPQCAHPPFRPQVITLHRSSLAISSESVSNCLLVLQKEFPHNIRRFSAICPNSKRKSFKNSSNILICIWLCS